MTQLHFEMDDEVVKVGGRYGGPGTIVGWTRPLDETGYRLYNVAMKVADGEGQFIHVFPAAVLRKADLTAERQYLNLLRHIMDNGVDRSDRTGTGTRSVFGHQLRFDLAKGFPLLTTKKVFSKGVIHELLWLISGSTNIKYLVDNGVHIWDEWADENGDLGPVYGEQWRAWPHREIDGKLEPIDQLRKAIESIKKNPDGRRHIVSAWNPGEVDKMALPPCHCFFQFYVADGKLSCQLYQRSADVFLGVPFNIASYALLTMIVAQVCGLGLGDFIHTFGDVHIYHNHFDQVKEQLTREPRAFPEMFIDPNIKDIDDFRFEHFRIDSYDPHPPIKAPVAV